MQQISTTEEWKALARHAADVGTLDLREQVLETWMLAFERSPLTPEDLEEIPFTLLIPNCKATFMEHKRCVVHVARRAAE